jgi:hypothetical protein
MSASKRYITKESILSNLDHIDSVLSADCLIFDRWSSKFFEDLNREERKLRESYSGNLIKQIISDVAEDSKNFKSLSETLISLHNNPMWVDIEIVSKRLGLDIEYEDSGQLFKIARIASDRIIEHFDKPDRNDKIEDILSD